MKRLLTVATLAVTLFAVSSLEPIKKWAQCQAQSGQFQCPLQALPGSEYCDYHKSWDPKNPKKPD